jgi:hypothetical protein
MASASPTVSRLTVRDALQWTGTFDGKDNPVVGDPNRDVVTRQETRRVRWRSRIKAGKVTATIPPLTREGKVRVETTTGNEHGGEQVRNVTAWTKS